MSYEQQNRAAVIDYFNAGAKGACARSASEGYCGALGVEIEHFVVHKGSLAPVVYEADGEAGVRQVLEHLAPFYPDKTYGSGGELLGLARADHNLTLEPAAQLEISIAPFQRIADIVGVYGEFRALVDPFLSECGYELAQFGYHPSARALDLPLIPKQRYRYMNDYFARLGTHGERMMRASASTQVSVDYASEADAVRKMRVAQALAPILAALTQNVTCFEGAAPDGPLARFHLWRDVDDARCGSVPGLFEEGFGFEAYADWVLGACPIFITRPAKGQPESAPRTRSVAVSGETAAEAYAQIPMTTDDVEHLLSMFWPDVRLKRFVEIRPADSLPISQAAAYTALVKGLFYSEESLSAIEAAFGVANGVWPLDDGSTDRAVEAIMAHGDQAVLQGRTLPEWKTLLFGLAADALSPDEAAMLSALA